MKHAVMIYLLSAGAALAHGGHEEAVLQGDAHWLTSGDHVIVLMLAAFAIGSCVRSVVRRASAAPRRA